MTIQRLGILIIFGLMSFSASADFRTVMEVHEVELPYLTLPASVNGTLTFSDCDECSQLSIRATVATRYSVNGQTVSLADFRRAIAGITNRSQQIVDVFHDLESNTVIQVRVKL